MIDARVGPATVGAMEVSSMLTGYTRGRGRLRRLGGLSQGVGAERHLFCEFRSMLVTIAESS